MISKITKFYKEQILNPSLEDASKFKSFLIHQAKIIVLSFRGFNEEKLNIRASALTFYTMLSVVPIVAMAVGVAKGFGFESKMEEFIIDNFRGQEEVMNWVIELSQSVLNNVEGGLLAGIGLVILVWSVMQVLTNIEDSFNAIWQVKSSRPFFRKMSDYMSLMLIAPFLIIISSSVMVYISTSVQTANDSYAVIHMISPAVKKLLSIVPYTLVWLLFTITYIVMPNTKVNFKYALIAGIIAGTMFQITQWAYIHFQIGVTTYSTLYGTFAALPLFLAWLQISWLIVLLGAEISFAFQNVANYEFEAGSLKISINQKRLLSLLVVYHIIKNFMDAKPPMTSSEISHDLGIPIRLTREILFNLKQGGIIIETITESAKDVGYTPALDINQIDIKYVIDKLDNFGPDQVRVSASKTYTKLTEIHRNFMNSLKGNSVNVLLKDL